jgi:hypothetical protein
VIQQFKGWKVLVRALAIFAATFASVASVNAGVGFGDVLAGQYCTNAVHWMVEEEIIFGTAPGCFQPSEPATRGQVASFIHRFKDKPNGATEPLSDVEPGDFFADAVEWMFSEATTTGVTPTSFAPDRPVTSAPVATFLYRLAGQPPVKVGADGVSPPASDNNHLVAAEALLFQLLNETRASLGLDPLVRDETMDAFARAWSATVDSLGNLGHSNGP